MNKEFRTSDNIIAKDDENMIVEGYALKFNRESNLLGEFVEVISPEALRNADLSDVRCLIDHNSSYVLGRTVADTLKLEVDDVGLRFRCELPNTSYARDLYENIKLGNINQCSFGFTIEEDGDEFERREDGIFKRTVNKIRSLFDVSIVTYPAYEDTDVAPALRSIKNIKENEQKQIEQRRLMEKANAALKMMNI
ncbi:MULTISPECIES: HK97 family phage prohead protease [Staphylococcus]|uniref:HK97 family phage prohead protease n=1 Tax=Staphylococcus hominis TaxID=1290 RepID=A0A8X8GU20_STAHO|nr:MULTISPECIES: HK97 family phage prohead protease [Staphylococcus]OHO58424.1 peptidase U35 [Staphylococcus sp. HMSC035F02]MCM5673128.1 HK97 family phage prohead protease [Staphylococcus hominis]MDO0983722.1 HK97 family phage prohead protease [Staphylococcus hominis]MDS3898545.1 HK97 family phage prohead protease [Staphylococcus hominis]OFQ58294.1 peptidase U35 [Staphylococcus sp. HMSC068C09]